MFLDREAFRKEFSKVKQSDISNSREGILLHFRLFRLNYQQGGGGVGNSPARCATHINWTFPDSWPTGWPSQNQFWHPSHIWSNNWTLHQFWHLSLLVLTVLTTKWPVWARVFTPIGANSSHRFIYMHQSLNGFNSLLTATNPSRSSFKRFMKN